jgi:rod shape-determining protein MreD
MKVAGVLAALAAALVLQATLAGITLEGATLVNLVLVAVVYVALAFGAVTGMLAGTAGGLAQDALAGGIVGVGGMSKTLVGFIVGVLGAQFIVSQTLPRFVMFVGATFAHEVTFQALQALIEARPFAIQWSATLTQAAVNGLIGILAFQVVELSPGMMQRRRARGSSLSRRRY